MLMAGALGPPPARSARVPLARRRRPESAVPKYPGYAPGVARPRVREGEEIGDTSGALHNWGCRRAGPISGSATRASRTSVNRARHRSLSRVGVPALVDPCSVGVSEIGPCTNSESLPRSGVGAVSYTHLTLPTIYSV